MAIIHQMQLTFPGQSFYRPTLHPNIKDIVLLVHATLQWHSIGEEQSKFFMLGDIFSDPVHLNRSVTETPEKRLCKRCLLPVFDI